MNADQLVQELNWRYAVKKFDANKKIDAKTWNALEESLILTPSSYGLQPWQFYVLTNQEMRQKLTALSWNQKQVEECSHYVVFVAKKVMDENYIQEFISSTAHTRNVEIDSLSGYKRMMEADLVKGARATWIKEWAARQAYIALGNFMTCAAILGVDTCPMEGIQPADYDQMLGLNNSTYQTVVACAAGYRSQDDKYQHAKKVRFGKEKLIVSIP